MSKHLNNRQLQAINKIGDSMVSGDEELPDFSRSGCVTRVDRILDHMPARDLDDLKMLLTVFSFLPAFLVGWVMKAIERSPSVPGPVGAVLRLVRIGLRGLIMTLYYSDEKILKRIGYEVGVYTSDQN